MPFMLTEYSQMQLCQELLQFAAWPRGEKHALPVGLTTPPGGSEPREPSASPEGGHTKDRKDTQRARKELEYTLLLA